MTPISATADQIRINDDRLWSSIMQMAAIGGTPKGGCDRQALTDVDRAGRDLFVSWARDAGCRIRIDAVGNIFARRDGREANGQAVAAGSHLDTQATGGRFDGVYGVLAGLEVVRTLNDSGVETQLPLEVICWTNEEGCRFAPAMLGSGVFCGAYDLDFAYARLDRDGRSFGEELQRIGYKGADLVSSAGYAALFEAHIEQGPILEHENRTIGVVTGIQGAYWLDVTLTGTSAHAGPTPMEMRRDPWRAAAPIVSEFLALAGRHAPWGRATIGDVRAFPGSRNTVPESLTLALDVRHPDPVVLDEMVRELGALIDGLAATAAIEATVRQVWHMPPASFDPRLVAVVEKTAQALELSTLNLVSGAGHDSLHTAAVAPTAMIFVPCEGGVSHNESESADPADLAAGANVLLHAMLAIAKPAWSRAVMSVASG